MNRLFFNALKDLSADLKSAIAWHRSGTNTSMTIYFLECFLETITNEIFIENLRKNIEALKEASK